VEKFGIVTFDFILNCWKKKEYPLEFEKLLEDYIIQKEFIFANVEIFNITSWLSKILCSIEIGIGLNKEKFLPYKNAWRKKLGKDWIVSLEDGWVVWKE
jgi:hypothetical protein